jgi:hypothetical protein
MPVVAVGRCFRGRLGLIHGRDYTAGFVEENLAGPGHARAAGGALQQPHAQAELQILDRTRQWRLFYVQALGRAHEVQFFSDGDVVAEMSQLHLAFLP